MIYWGDVAPNKSKIGVIKITEYTSSRITGVIAKSYNPTTKEWTWGNTKVVAAYEIAPKVYGIYLYTTTSAGITLVGDYLYRTVPFASIATFAIDANQGVAELKEGAEPTTEGTGTVLQNNTFCFDNTRGLKYALSSSITAMSDFTIEMDFTITSDPGWGYWGFLSSNTSWGSGAFVPQWRRNGYLVSNHWNGVNDGGCGSTDHSTWVNDGVYHHVAFVHEGTTYTLYCDGVSEFTMQTSSTLNLNICGYLWIGYNAVDGGKILPGRMKHFQVVPEAIYSKAFPNDIPTWVGA